MGVTAIKDEKESAPTTTNAVTGEILLHDIRNQKAFQDVDSPMFSLAERRDYGTV